MNITIRKTIDPTKIVVSKQAGSSTVSFHGKKAKKTFSALLDIGDDDENDREGEDDDDDHDDDGKETKKVNNDVDPRHIVNLELRKEQYAIRQRLQEQEQWAASAPTTATTIENQSGKDTIDYDIPGAIAHDTLLRSNDDNYYMDNASNNNNSNINNNEVNTTATTTTGKQSSRYMQDLLQQATRRKRERDEIYERRILRDQTMEEKNNEELINKDKFVTASYKRKLAERQQWIAEETKNDLIEQTHDVTKQSDGSAITNFYVKLQRNVAAGGVNSGKAVTDPTNNSTSTKGNSITVLSSVSPLLLSSTTTTTAASIVPLPDLHAETSSSSVTAIQGNDSTMQQQHPKNENARLMRRQLREMKISQARRRYFQRHNIPINDDE
jgi:hypothetical protein